MWPPLVGTVACLFGCAAEPENLECARSSRPNIVVIVVDDMGFSDLGCYGSEVATPNLDRLAAGGLRFTQFYNNARCCPSRASLLTGLYPHQAGIGYMDSDLGKPAYQGYLNDRCVTIGEALQRGGYQTLLAGKWHVGEQRPHWPVDRGFERSFAMLCGERSYYRLEAGDSKMALDDQPWAVPDDQFYMTDAITEHANRFVAAWSSWECWIVAGRWRRAIRASRPGTPSTTTRPGT
jgi:arylsulfatase A-like enzyme